LVTIKFNERSKIMLTSILPIVALNTLTMVSGIVAVIAIIAVVILKKRSS